MLSQRQRGSLPSNTETNPNAHVNAVTTRSGKQTTDPPFPSNENVVNPVNQEENDKVKSQSSPSTTHVKTPLKPYEPKLPYLGRYKKEKEAEQYGKFLDLFKQLHINLPFVEALSQMPKYAKFLKDLLTNKKKLEDLSTVIMSEECSAVLDGKLPKKMSDPGSFTIPCLIGNLSVHNALADLGASINLMPYSMYAKLGLSEPKPTRMTIQLADRSIKYPRGIIENLLVKVDRFVFLVDFVILDMDEDSKVPLILGRPFLSTSRCLVDVYEKKMTLLVDGEEVIFYIDKSMKYSPKQDDALYYIDTIEPLVEENFQEIFKEDLFDTNFIGGEDMNMSNEEVLEELAYLIENDPSSRPNKEEEIESGTRGKPKTSFKEPPVLELKDLPPHLEYAFLESESKLSVIISSDLTGNEKEKLIEVLKANKEAIAWKLSDIKGINPSYCTHKILLVDEYKPVVQPQRRINPKVQDVVKKEAIKLLDA
ncbi:putative nucleotidyltransferase, ribonuclease H [Tanacetum coccineum]|uniref:Nucleotidyltransferase, ribonuclease H n=1 Tax=Tanacetum coccineum TaxID=301880 RepID=A0ABQ5HX17_9ASTR